jgi:hypothetical protein
VDPIPLAALRKLVVQNYSGVSAPCHRESSPRLATHAFCRAGSSGAQVEAGSEMGFDPLGSSPNQISGRGRELLVARRPNTGNRQCRQDSGWWPLSNYP